MESDIGNLVKIISITASRRNIVEAFLVSTMTLQLYDWLLILPQEVKYIWRASWNWSKVLYLLTRYLPFAIISFSFRNHFSPNPTLESCKRSLYVIGWVELVGVDLAEVVLAVRTYAIWKRDKRVGIGLALLLGLSQIPNAIFLSKFIQGIGYTRNPYPDIFSGCTYNKANRLVYVIWIVITIVEGVVLTLTIISAVKAHREHTSNLMHVIYRDGIRFYLYIFCATLTNVLVVLLLPIDFVGIGSDVEVVLHSILTCRLMIGMREANQSYGRTFELSEMPRRTTLEFVRRPSDGSGSSRGTVET